MKPIDAGGEIKSLSVSPNGKRIASLVDVMSFSSRKEDKSIRIWDVDQGNFWFPPLGTGGKFLLFTFDKKWKKMVAVAHDGALYLWDDSLKPICNTRGVHGDIVFSVAFNPDGTRIVTGHKDGAIRLWSPSTCKSMGELLPRRHYGIVSSIAFSKDGKFIVSGGGEGDNILQIWDALKQTPLGKPLYEHENEVLSVAFNSDGDRIISGSSDKTLRLWDSEF